MTSRHPLPELLQAFFTDWLARQRDLSVHTIRSYRDTWRLFLRFLQLRHRRDVSKLTFDELSASEVLAFLDHKEHVSHATVGTRNCRLAALRAFFAFVLQREPSVAAQCAEVLRIPHKRASRPAINSLESEEIEAILAQPNLNTAEGQRDHALIALLYNTGARIQEALDLCPGAIRFEPPASVKLFGKGRKERICPLWPETVKLIKSLLRCHPRSDDQPIFINRYGQPLGASGVRYKLAQYVRSAAKTVPSLAKKKISPHTFRHSTAVHLVAAGVDITVIRAWLGHVNLETTAHYAQANLDTKRAALEQVTPPRSSRTRARWRRDTDLLAWLDSL